MEDSRQESVARMLANYLGCIETFVSGKTSADEFETAYLRIFKSDSSQVDGPEYVTLENLFFDVDDYVADPDLRDTDSIGPNELRRRAQLAFEKLYGLTEHLPKAGQTLSVDSFGYMLVLSTDAGFTLQIEGVVQIDVGGSPLLSAAASDIDASAIGGLLDGKIRSSSVRSGQLSISLVSGVMLTVEPDPDFEAWNFTAPGGVQVVCMPGGELATWSAG